MRSEFQQCAERLSALTGRIVVTYYSGWLHVDARRNPGDSLTSDIQAGHVDTLGALVRQRYTDNEVRRLGIDLVLHTPGGELNATKQLGNYLLQTSGGNFRTIVPHRAMSAGTLLACAGQSILLHSQSALGQTDPIVYGVPALHWISDYESTIELVKEEPRLNQLMSRYPVGIVPRAMTALASTRNLLVEWLRLNMLKDEDPIVATTIAEKLCNNTYGDHAMPLSLRECREIGLKVCDFGDDLELTSAIFAIHDAAIDVLLESRLPIIIAA